MLVHPTLKLGKAPAFKDMRTLKLKSILKQLPEVPMEWSFDDGKSIPTPMFANNKYGCCVISGRAHQTLRFEKTEQGSIIPISDDDVTKEYFKESGGEDSGLIMLDSLKDWRVGWSAGGKQYNIHAFASVNPKDPMEVRAAAFGLTGLNSGFSLPVTAANQFDAGQIWDVVSCWSRDSWKGSWGGHCVYICGYNDIGPICITWGRRQQMTWRFMARYCDELFGIVDDRDKFLSSSIIDVEAMENYLYQVAG